MGAWLGLERNQVLFSQATGKFYFVPVAQRREGSSVLLVKGKKIDVTSSVHPLVAHTVAHHLRQLARSSTFDARGHAALMAAARDVEKKAKISAPDNEG